MTTRDASLKHAKAILCWLAIRTVQMGMLYPNIITMRGLRCLQKPFGARFYDPLFGLWLTPDPAGQFANPYTYGGDPLNYIDPNGESIMELGAISRELNHRYSSYWSFNTQKYAMDRYLRNMSIAISCGY